MMDEAYGNHNHSFWCLELLQKLDLQFTSLEYNIEPMWSLFPWANLLSEGEKQLKIDPIEFHKWQRWKTIFLSEFSFFYLVYTYMWEKKSKKLDICPSSLQINCLNYEFNID